MSESVACLLGALLHISDKAAAMPYCTAGAGVCSVPVSVECPGGYQATADGSICVRCQPGMNVSASEPYICQGSCKGEMFNETCYANCNRGHVFHGEALVLAHMSPAASDTACMALRRVLPLSVPSPRL